MTAQGIRVDLTLDQYERLRAVNPRLPAPDRVVFGSAVLTHGPNEVPKVDVSMFVDIPEPELVVTIPADPSEWVGER